MILKELFRIVEGDNVFTYTSQKGATTYNGETYEPLPIGRGQVDSKTQLEKASVDIKVPLDSDLGQHFKMSSVDEVVTLTIYRDEDGGVSTFWKGRLAQPSTTGRELTLTFESVFTSLRRPGLRARYQKSCRHVLYGRGCGLNMEDYAVTVQITAINGTVVTVDDAGSASYLGGMIRAPSGVLRGLIAQSGNVLTMLRPWQELVDTFNGSGYGMSYGGAYGGLSATIYRGCKHTLEDCKTFTKMPDGSTNADGNIDNYGGYPWIPSGSKLFQGGSVT